jgi:pyridoxamine 5'-phosphate oxidase
MPIFTSYEPAQEWFTSGLHKFPYGMTKFAFSYFLPAYLCRVENLNEFLKHSRQQYDKGILAENHLDPDPIKQFNSWMEMAVRDGIPEPNAMDLATVDEFNRPSNRIVLLRSCEERGFTFYTNYESRKGKSLVNNGFAGLNFFWQAQSRQVRIEGAVHKLKPEDSDDYFNSRPRESQIGAWASAQSTYLSSRKELENRIEELEKKYEGINVPRPPHWGGFIVIPDRIEFWQGRPNRLHDRFLYERANDLWMVFRLAP